jgi:hypothetical protein
MTEAAIVVASLVLFIPILQGSNLNSYDLLSENSSGRRV